MSETDVVALDIGREPVGSMEFVEEVRVLAERVLEGDREFRRDDTPTVQSGLDRESNQAVSPRP
jgi:hypothetical protein